MAVANRDRKTWSLDNFGAGIDRRDGVISREQNRFFSLENAHVTKGKKIRRRCPLIKVTGAFNANCFGLVLKDGALYTFAPTGATATAPTGVSLLRFDVPPGATAHALVDVDNMNDDLVVLMKHTIGGVDSYWLHVLDSQPDLPTYTQDPEFPWLHYTGTLPRAVLAIAANKAWLSGPKGNTYRSGVARARKWWTRTLEDILTGGYEFHFYLGATGSQSVTVPLDATRIGSWTSGYVAWVVEKYTGTGVAIEDYAKDANWGTRLSEVASSPASGECAFGTTTNTSTGATYANWISVTINAAAIGWYRVRIFPPQSIDLPCLNYLSSGGINYETQNNGGAWFVPLNGDGVTTDFDLDPLVFVYLVDSTDWNVIVNGTALTFGVDYTLLNPFGKAVRIHFGAAPADGALISVAQYAIGITDLIVPPGILQTRDGKRAWGGGTIAKPTIGFSYWLTITLDSNSNPTGLAFLPITPLTGKMLYERVVVARYVYGSSVELLAILIQPGQIGSRGVIIASLGDYQYRDTTIDETLWEKAGDDVGATDTTVDGGLLPTASHDNSGGAVTALVGAKDRLLVYFKGAAQLWQVGEDGNQDRLLSKSEFGTGEQPTAHGVLFGGSVMMATLTGPRIVSIAGQLSDRLDDSDIEESIERLGKPLIAAAESWPFTSQYVAGCTIGGTFGFLVFDYSRESKIAAWSQWTCAGVPSVDYKGLVAVNDRLYVRSGTDLYYFDASVFTAALPSFRDTNDGLTAYESRLVWNFNDFQKPGTNKKFLFFDMVQAGCGLDPATGLPATAGQSTLSFKVLPSDQSQQLDADTTAGTTYGLAREGLSMIAQAIAPILVTTDEGGWELQRLAIDYEYLRR